MLMVAIATLADDTRTMKQRQHGLYTEDYWDRPHSERLGALGGVAVNWAAEKIVRALPDAPTGNIIGETINGLKTGLTTRFNTKMHTNGLTAFENPIPGLRKIIQNGWSMYHLCHGLTNIGAAYTYLDSSGNEQLWQLQAPGSLPIEVDKKGLGAYANRTSVRASSVNELMDFELEKSRVVDITQFPPKYMRSELWFIGRKGNRTAAGVTPSGDPVFRYERPSKWEFLEFFGRMDLMYSAVDCTIGHVEKALPAGAAKQDFYEREVEGVIRSTLRHYGNTRDDGITNPFAGMYSL